MPWSPSSSACPAGNLLLQPGRSCITSGISTGLFQGSAEPLAFAAPFNVCEYAQTDLNLISITSAFVATHTATSRQRSLCARGVHTHPEHWPSSGMSLPKNSLVISVEMRF